MKANNKKVAYLIWKTNQ